MMKYKLLPLILVVICITLTACGATPAAPDVDVDNGPSTADLPVEPPAMADDNAVAQWVEPAVEALVREKLNQPNGDIMLRDLDYIWGIELFGDTHIYFNADDGYTMWKSIDDYTYSETIWNPANINVVFEDAEKNRFKTGVYSVDEVQYTRGSISSLVDFGNFRNIRFLHVFKNSLDDLSGLSVLENLIELKLIDNDINDITALSELVQIESLWLQGGQIEDVSPLSNLSRLSYLYLQENHISNLDALSSLYDLKRLNFSFNPVTNLEVLKEFDQLIYLWFSKTSVNDLSPLIGKTSIRALTMENLNIDSIDLAPLATLNGVGTLSIRQDRAELLNFNILGTMKQLWCLDILGSVGVSDEDIDWLRKELPGCPLT